MGTTHARWIRRTVHSVVGVLVWLFGLPSLLLAHGGGMTGEEVRPMAISGGLALISYWTVVLWPKRKKADPDYRGPLRKMQARPGRLKMTFGRRRDGDSRLRPLKQVAHLRQVPRAGGRSYGPDSISNG